MQVIEYPGRVSVTTRAGLQQGQVFRYLDAKGKPGLRMVCETPSGKDGLYSVRLSDGVLMHSAAGSDSAEKWAVEVVGGSFIEGGFEHDSDEDDWLY